MNELAGKRTWTEAAGAGDDRSHGGPAQAAGAISGTSVDTLVHKIASAAVEAMLYEAAATPKPGLVDRRGSGAHRDMDFFTFMASAAALHTCFDEMARAGIACRAGAPEAMWPELRAAGLRAEARMFEATGGVNTHKGEIFSLGLLCGCAGWLLGGGAASGAAGPAAGRPREAAAEQVAALAARMSRGLCAAAFGRLAEQPALTKGERVYLRYGCRGARGEAEDGYPLVVKVALPIFKKHMARGVPVNDALVETLLHLIAAAEDTNILSRHDRAAAAYARACAARAIGMGGVFTEEGRNYIDEMDRDFTERYISPGGSADLLAVTFFLYTIEGISYLSGRYL